jgi:hypothetical protein
MPSSPQATASPSMMHERERMARLERNHRISSGPHRRLVGRGWSRSSAARADLNRAARRRGPELARWDRRLGRGLLGARQARRACADRVAKRMMWHSTLARAALRLMTTLKIAGATTVLRALDFKHDFLSQFGPRRGHPDTAPARTIAVVGVPAQARRAFWRRALAGVTAAAR